MATIERRQNKTNGVHYRVTIRLKGHPVQRATFRRKTDAGRWAQQTESAIRDGRHFKTAESKRRLVKDAIALYIDTVLPTKARGGRNQLNQLNWWRVSIGDYSLAEVSPALLGTLRDRLLKEPGRFNKRRSNATVNRYLAAMSHVLTTASREWGWIDNNTMRLVRKLKEPSGRVRFLSEEERALLLNACRRSENEDLHSIVVIALCTGMRHGEILGLAKKDIDLQRRMLVCHKTKNGERRKVPLAPAAFNILQTRVHQLTRRSALLFPSPKDAQRPVDIRSAWETAVKRADIEDFHFHDLRHSAASYLAMSGATLAELAEILGHKTLSMVKRYAHLSEAHTAGVVNRMADKFMDL